eukprot:CAMPEP_0179009494 /NCGR_PEP_ID=MMETSP0795-20121207/16302_1 /TAXON_ID=88552 /ORGANISM="Amoebophrya sp., Strain Ameob2" /LENGTH=505 /DNA_ID=CAMNT_0020704695 /DNA_START=301 /DNA_END=1818 /DNA_ORIENTATION=+
MSAADPSPTTTSSSSSRAGWASDRGLGPLAAPGALGEPGGASAGFTGGGSAFALSASSRTRGASAGGMTGIIGPDSILERTKPDFLRSQESRIKQMEYDLRHRRLEDEVEGLTRIVNDYKQKYETARDAQQDAQHELARLHAEFSATSAKCGELHDENKKLQDLCDGFVEVEKAKLEARVAELETALEESSRGFDSTKEELEETRRHAAELERECGGQGEEIVGLREKLEQTQAALCQSTNRGESFYAKIDKYKQEVDGHKALTAQLQYQLQAESAAKEKAKLDRKREKEVSERLRLDLGEVEQQLQIVQFQLQDASERNSELCKELSTGGTNTGVKIKSRAAKWAKEVEALHKWKGKALITIHALQAELKTVQGKYHKYLQYAHKLHQQSTSKSLSTRDGGSSREHSASVGSVYPPPGPAPGVATAAATAGTASALPSFSNPLLAAQYGSASASSVTTKKEIDHFPRPPPSDDSDEESNVSFDDMRACQHEHTRGSARSSLLTA